MIVENEASPCEVCMAQSVAADCEDVPLCAACAADVNTEALAMIAELVGYDGGDIVVAVRDRLAAVEAERDALQQQVVQWWGKDATALLRADRILAALRQPSKAVCYEGLLAFMKSELSGVTRTDIAAMLRAAVAAAEKEVGS